MFKIKISSPSDPESRSVNKSSSIPPLYRSITGGGFIRVLPAADRRLRVGDRYFASRRLPSASGRVGFVSGEGVVPLSLFGGEGVGRWFIISPPKSINVNDYQIRCVLNKDGNIHKSEALKWKDKRTLTLVECQNRISRI